LTPTPTPASTPAPAPSAAAASPPATARADAAAKASALLRSPEELAEAKARRRATVRRSQLRRRAAPNGLGVVDVMVLEADGEMRAQLCGVLEAFGYRPHLAVSVPEAEGLSLRRLYVAAFLGVSGDANETAALCRRLRDAPRGRPSALIAVTDRQRHTDRVRMQLAGADQTIFRPPGRGDVARALEACGLAMPHDPRQATPPEE
jgi:CheY-like chemotaxis protein